MLKEGVRAMGAGLFVTVTDITGEKIGETFSLDNPKLDASYQIPDGIFAGILKVSHQGTLITFVGSKHHGESVTINGTDHMRIEHAPRAISVGNVLNLKKGKSLIRLQVIDPNASGPVMSDSSDEFDADRVIRDAQNAQT